MLTAFTAGLMSVFTPMGLLGHPGRCSMWNLCRHVPGLSSVMGMSIMLPVALAMDGNMGVLMMLGIFCGAIYGGSITAIMINTPGTANSAATCLDGYPMAHKYHQPGRCHLYFHHCLYFRRPVLCFNAAVDFSHSVQFCSEVQCTREFSLAVWHQRSGQYLQ